jgi:hypothetical protein
MLHRVALQNDILICLLPDPLHVHVVALLVLVVNLIDANKDLIIIMVEQLLDDDIDNQQRGSEADGVLAGVDVHVHRVYMLDLAIEVRLLAIDKKLIVLLPYFGMMFQVR